MAEKVGKLFVCATPIGNLKDITLRALEVLQEVDFILAEDTRITIKLLKHFGIKKPLYSYHQHSPPKRTYQLLEKMRDGKNIALVCSAGTPTVSDPGAPLVRSALEEGFTVVAVPGASTITAALSVSGMDAQRFLFLGFLPRSDKEFHKLLEQVKNLPFTLVVYEAPHRLKKTLSGLLNVIGDRPTVLCRELTKLHEEVTLTNLSTIHQRFQTQTPQGEFTLVIEGATFVPNLPVDEKELDNLLTRLLSEGYSVKDCVREVIKRLKVSRRYVYKRALNLKRSKEVGE